MDTINRIITILLLLGNGFSAHCQQMFTHIPHRDYARVYSTAEIGNHYYFISNQIYPINGISTGGYHIHKTDLHGNIVDSLLLMGALHPDLINISSDNNLLCLYTLRGTNRNTLGYAANFSLGRIRYDSNLNFMDSFSVSIPPSGFRAGNSWYSQRFADRIIYINKGEDTTITNSAYLVQDKFFVLDTLGNFLFDRAILDTSTYQFNAIASTNNGKNFIIRFGGIDTATNYIGGMFRLLDDSLHFIKWAPEPNNYDNNGCGLDRYSTDKFTLGFIKRGIFAQPLKDSFCVDLRDTNFNLIKQTCIPRHASLANYPQLDGNGFDQRWYDGKNKNSIFIGNNRGAQSVLILNSYFTLSNLDSNLNLRWAKVFGGDFPYQIERYTSVSDGGCFIMGIRRLGNSQTDSLEPVVFKINQMGAITGITSFAPSVQSFFTSYPNPSQGLSYIKNTYNKPYELMIFSQEGKLVYHKQDIKDVLFSFDISSFASGMYLYKIRTSDGKSAGGKLLKN